MNLAKMHMKVSVFYEKTTNLPKNDAKRSVKTQGFSKIMKNIIPKPRILRGTPRPDA